MMYDRDFNFVGTVMAVIILIAVVLAYFSQSRRERECADACQRYGLVASHEWVSRMNASALPWFFVRRAFFWRMLENESSGGVCEYFSGLLSRGL